MSGASSRPYRERIADAVSDEFTHDESLLAATRFSLPRTKPTRVDETGKESSGMGMALLQQLMVIVRPPPKPIAGFPVYWDMVAALFSRHRIVLWRPRRGTDQPALLLGAVRLIDLREIVLTTMPVPGGRTLATKFVPRSGPRVMLDVVVGFREDTEHFVLEGQRQLRLHEQGR